MPCVSSPMDPEPIRRVFSRLMVTARSPLRVPCRRGSKTVANDFPLPAAPP